ncbi:MAG TPA: hypothetical protein VGN26_12515 [Armatimonadota bacterium]
MPQLSYTVVKESIQGATLVGEYGLDSEDPDLAELKARADRLRIANQGQMQYHELQARWSAYAFRLLCGTLLFQALLVLLIGWKKIDFTGYHDLVLVVVGENFLQIVGIAYLVVKHLFPAPPDPSSGKDGPEYKGGAARVTRSIKPRKSGAGTADPPAATSEQDGHPE